MSSSQIPGCWRSDIEISDEYVILKAEDARKLKEPPRLTRIEIRPSVVSLKPGESTSFAIFGFDQHGRDIACPGATWTPSGGDIDAQGRFTAGGVGVFQITARVESLEAFAQARVADETPPSPKRRG